MPTDAQSSGGGYGLRKANRYKAKTKSQVPTFTRSARTVSAPISREATKEVQRTEQSVGSQTIQTKRYPSLPSYTSRQRQTIVKEQGKELAAARKDYRLKNGAQALNEFDQRGGFEKLGDRRTRTQLSILGRAYRGEQSSTRAKIGAKILQNEGVDASHAPRELKIQVAKQAEKQHVERDGRLKEGQPKKKYSFTGDTLKTLGLAANPLTAVPALLSGEITVPKVLKELGRPTSAVTGAVDALHHGESPLKGAVENFKTQKVSGSDLTGMPKGSIGAAVLGTAIDIGADPLNLATAGVGAPAKAAVTAARRAAEGAVELRAAAAAAKSAQESATLIRRAEKLEAEAAKLSHKATTASANKGIQVGLRLPGGKTFKTSGEATASLSRLSGASKAATKIRESRAGQAVGKLSPGFRPAGVSDHDWEIYRAEQRRARASAQQGRDLEVRSGRAYNHELRKAAEKDGITVDEARRKAADAIERAMLTPGHRTNPSAEQTYSLAQLSREAPETFKVALALRKDLRTIAREEQGRGLLGATRTNYLPHVPTRAYAKALQREQRANRRGALGNPYAKVREHEGSLSEIERELPTDAPMFDRNIGTLKATRGIRHRYLVAQNDLSREVVARLARPLKAAERRPSDGIYVVDKGGNLRAAHANAKLAEGEEMVLLPKAIGDNVLRGPLHTIESHRLGRTWDRFTGAIKTALTTLNLPAYQVRNLWGDLWFAYQADTSPTAVADAVNITRRMAGKNRRAARSLNPEGARGGTITLGHGIEKPMDDFIQELRDHGIVGTGHFGTDYTEDLRISKGGDPADQLQTRVGESPLQGIRAAGRSPIRAARAVGGLTPIRGIRGLSQPLEDAPRIATYLSARRKGMTADEAADWVARHHIDYGDLSDVEKRYVRRVIPFWTFMSRNTVNQTRNLIQRPGKFANYGFAMEEGRKQAGLPEDWIEKLPEYYQRGLPIPVKLPNGKETKLLFPQLPITDLNRLAYIADPKEQTDLLLQALHPAIKVLAEDRLNYSFFFRGPIRQDDDNPDVSRWTPAPWWVKQLPMPVRKVLAGGDSGAAEAGLWTKRADYWMRVLPATNAITQAGTSKEGSRGQTALDAVASQATGVKVNIYDEDKYALNRLYEERDKIDRKITDAHQLGRTPDYQLTLRRNELDDQIAAARGESRSSGGLSGLPSSGGSSGFPSSSGGNGFPSSSSSGLAGLP